MERQLWLTRVRTNWQKEIGRGLMRKNSRPNSTCTFSATKLKVPVWRRVIMSKFCDIFLRRKLATQGTGNVFLHDDLICCVEYNDSAGQFSFSAYRFQYRYGHWMFQVFRATRCTWMLAVTRRPTTLFWRCSRITVSTKVTSTITEPCVQLVTFKPVNSPPRSVTVYLLSRYLPNWNVAIGL